MNKESMLIMLQDGKTIISLDSVTEFRTSNKDIYAYKNLSGNNVRLGTYDNDKDIEEVMSQLLYITKVCGVYTLPKINEIVRSEIKIDKTKG